MANNCFKNCPICLPVREMQIKSTLRYHLTLIGMLSAVNLTTVVGKDVQRKEP